MTYISTIRHLSGTFNIDESKIVWVLKEFNFSLPDTVGSYEKVWLEPIFENTFQALGFSEINKTRHNGFPDYYAIEDGQEVGVELEKTSQGFLSHGHLKEGVDYIICLKKTRGIETVKIVEIFEEFDYNEEELKEIQQYFNRNEQKKIEEIFGE